MNKKLLYLLLINIYTLQSLSGQTTKLVETLYEVESQSEVIKLSDFDLDGEEDIVTIKNNNLYVIFSCFKNESDTLMIVEGVTNSGNIFYEIDYFDISKDGYIDIITYRNGLHVFNPEDRSYEHYYLPFMFYPVESLVYGYIDDNDNIDFIINNEKIYYTEDNFTFSSEKIEPYESTPYLLCDINGDNLDELFLYKNIDGSGIFGSGEDQSIISVAENINGELSSTDYTIYSKNGSRYIWDIKPYNVSNKNCFLVSYNKGLVLLKQTGDISFDSIPISIQNDNWFLKNEADFFNKFKIIDIDNDYQDDIVFLGNSGAYWGHLDIDGKINDLISLDWKYYNDLEVLPVSNESDEKKIFSCDYLNGKFARYTNIDSNFFQQDWLGKNAYEAIQKVNVFNQQYGFFLADSILKIFIPKLDITKSLLEESTQPLNDVEYFSIIKYNDTTLFFNVQYPDNDTLFWYQFNKDFTLKLDKKIAQHDWKYAKFFPIDYNGNNITDYLIYKNKEVYMSLDTIDYSIAQRVLKNRYSNTKPGKFYITDFNNDGKNEYVMIEYLTYSYGGKDYYSRFYNSEFNLIAEYETHGYSDEAFFTDWDKDGNIEMLSTMEEVERYYMQDDTILMEELFLFSDFSNPRFMQRKDGKIDLLFRRFYSGSYIDNTYSLLSNNISNIHLSTNRAFSFEIFQEENKDTISIFFAQDSIASWFKINLENFAPQSAQSYSAFKNNLKPEILQANFTDYNNDNITDIIYRTTAGIFILEGKGNRAFEKSPRLILTENEPFYIEDLNADNKNDLLLVKDNNTYWYFNNNDSLVVSGSIKNEQLVEALNFDNDVNFEYLSYDDIIEIKNDGTYKYEYIVQNRLISHRGYPEAHISSAKINTDIYTDFFIWNDDTVFSVISDGNLDFTEYPIFAHESYYMNLYKEDLNNDSLDDLIIFCDEIFQPGFFDDSLYIFINQANGTFENTFKTTLESTLYTYPEFFDFTGDNLADIRIAREKRILENLGDGTFKETENYNRSVLPEEHADINNDSTIEFLSISDGNLELLEWVENEVPYFTSDIKNINVAIGEPLKYKVPENYVVDESNTELKYYIRNEDFILNAPYLTFLPENGMICYNNDYAQQIGIFNYEFRATDVLGNTITDAFTLTVENFVDVEQIEDISEISCYPNPTKDYINIMLPECSNDAQIFIYSNQGYFIKTLNIKNSEQIDVSYLPGGLYYIRIVDREINYFAKFIKI